MKLYAFADEACPMIDGQIAAMKRNGIDGLEIRGVDHQNVSDISCEQAREVRRRLDDAGLITWSVGSPVGKIDLERDDFAAHIEKFKHVLEIAYILEAENIRLFSFYCPVGRDPEDFRGEVLDRLGTLVDIARGSGIELCHENEKGIYGDRAVRCLTIHQALPEMKGVFDPANFIQCGQDVREAWQILKPYTKYMHIKDALPNGDVVPAGCGIGYIREIAADFIAASGGIFSVEPHLRVFTGFSDLERGNNAPMGTLLTYENGDAAFDAACTSFKTLMEE